MSKSIKIEQLNDVVTITFDQENSIANVFDENMFAELNEHIDFLEDNSKTIKGVIFQSAKPSIFIAGADLKFTHLNSFSKVKKLEYLFHKVLSFSHCQKPVLLFFFILASLIKQLFRRKTAIDYSNI